MRACPKVKIRLRKEGKMVRWRISGFEAPPGNGEDGDHYQKLVFTASSSRCGT